MMPRACSILLFLLVLFETVQSSDPKDLIANDVVSDYAEVKELLASFYKRHAKKYGHDYNPAAIRKIAENMDNAVATDKTEATVNRKLWNEVFENDIILTLRQAEALLSESNKNRKKRQAHPDPRNFWPNLTISYEFHGGEETWRTLIRSALRHVEQNVCIRFKENGGDRDGLRYYRGSGCWSNVGKIGGRQLVSLGYGCDALGIVTHETLHALGLWHEQSRDDRDNYITIQSDKITRGTEGNFEKRTAATSDNLGQPYDLGSVMHYGAKAFSFDWTSDTIRTRDWRYQNTIGQREGLSFKDAKMINTRYCQKVCPRILPCVNDGYTDPNRCGQCRCPAGYGGTYCEKVQYTACGGELYSTGSYQKIESGPVQKNANCIWRIRNPGGKVEITFDSVEFQCSDPCQSYVEVKWLTSKTATGARLCCKLPSPIVSEDDDVILIYRGSADTAAGWKGFSLRYRSIGGSPSPTGTTVRPSPYVTGGTTTRRPSGYTTTTRSPYWTKTASGWVHVTHVKQQKSFKTNGYAPKTSRKQIHTDLLIPPPLPSEEFASEPVPSNFSQLKTGVQTEQPARRNWSKYFAIAEYLDRYLAADLVNCTPGWIKPNQSTLPSGTTGTGSWGLWGEWSACSQPCGGCGKRTRMRGCYGGDQKCEGSEFSNEQCNSQACAKPKKGMICNGRLLLPCDLLSQLSFGSNNYLNPKFKQQGYSRSSTLPLPRVSLRKPMLKQAREIHPPTSRIYSSSVKRVKRQTATRLCEKRFIYNCPTGLLTINMEYKQPNDSSSDAYFQQYPECCSGYTPRSGVCYKN